MTKCTDAFALSRAFMALGDPRPMEALLVEKNKGIEERLDIIIQLLRDIQAERRTDTAVIVGTLNGIQGVLAARHYE